jgi:transcription elongation factor GreA
MVSPEEADYETGKLSMMSPVGKGLMGKSEGQEIEVQVPAGTLRYKILKIERP